MVRKSLVINTATIAICVGSLLIFGLIMRHTYKDDTVFRRKVTARFDTVGDRLKSVETKQADIQTIAIDVKGLVTQLKPLIDAENTASSNRQATLERLVDCTTPTGKCFQNLQRSSIMLLRSESQATRELVVKESGNGYVVETIAKEAPSPPQTVARCLLDANVTILGTDTIARVICPKP